jgi:hypothetical protein
MRLLDGLPRIGGKKNEFDVLQEIEVDSSTHVFDLVTRFGVFDPLSFVTVDNWGSISCDYPPDSSQAFTDKYVQDWLCLKED